MSKKIVNFEKKPDLITEYISELRMTADVIESIANTAQELGSTLAAQTGLDFSKFNLEQEDFEGFLKGGGDNPLVYTCQNSKMYYYLAASFDEEQEDIHCNLIRAFNNRIEEFDPESGQWKISGAVSELPEKFEKILDSQSPEADILETYLSETKDFSEAHYRSFRQAHRSLFSLYNQVYKYMEPYCQTERYGNVVLYLVPRGFFRRGFMVGQQEKFFILYQMVGIDYCLGFEYKREVGRTTDIAQIKHCLYQMANRYVDTDTYTLPLSLSASTESANPNLLGRKIFFFRKEDRKLDEKEKANLAAGKKAMQRFAEMLAESLE